MLLNLSNHPSTVWGVRQKAEAERLFGGVMDLPFPKIPAEADSNQVEHLAAEFCVQILGLSPVAVHIMGELTFCFTLVAQLQKSGLPCYASTTERRVSDEGPGGKTSHFSFVRFRLYPRVC